MKLERILTILIISMCMRIGWAALPDDAYLQKVFQALEKNPGPALSEDQKALAEKIVARLKLAAQKRQHTLIDGAEVETLGAAGIPTVAQLLRQPDAWLRGMAAQTLYTLDHRQSASFLIGLLTDTSSFNWRVDGSQTTVSSVAADLLEKIFSAPGPFRVALDEVDAPLSQERALQRWYGAHKPFSVWMGEDGAGVYVVNPLALYTGTPAEQLPEAMAKDPARFKQVLAVSLEDEAEGVFEPEQAVRARLVFRNAGTETLWLRWHRQNGAVHVLRMTGPDGAVLPQRLPPAPAPSADIPELQPLWKDNNRLEWSLELSKIYDLSRTGRYRFYYSYVPPAAPDPREMKTPADLSFWDGRQYVNYYDFWVR